MADRRYRPVNFGFLNTAQDSTDIGEFESPNATNLHPDELALGALKHQQYSGEGTLKDFTQTTMGGRRFFIGDSSQADRSYTEYGDGDQFTSSLNYTFPTAISNNIYAHVVAFDINISSSADGFILGNTTISTPVASGQLQVTTDTTGTDKLVFSFYDGTGVATGDIVEYNLDQWYRVVIVHNFSVSRGYSVYVDGKLAVDVAGISSGIGDAEKLMLGDTGNSGLTFRMRNLLVARRRSTTPGNFDGTVASLGFEDDLSEILISSRDGSGAGNDQESPFTKSGAPTSSPNESSVTDGALLFEVDGGARTADYRGYTRQTYSNIANTASLCARDLTFESDLYIGFYIRLEDLTFVGTPAFTRNMIHFETSGAPGTATGFRLELLDNDLRVRFEDDLGSWFTNTIRSPYLSGDGFYVSIIIRDQSTTSDNLQTATTYVDGQVVSELTQTVAGRTWALQGSSVRFAYASTVTVDTGTYTHQSSFRDLIVGNLRPTGDVEKLSAWAGESAIAEGNVNILLSSLTGSLVDSDQGFTESTPATFSVPEYVTPASITGLAVLSDLVAANDGPVTPLKPAGRVEEFLEVDDANLRAATAATGSFIDAPRLEVRSGKTYNGPEDASIVIGPISYTTATKGNRSYLQYRVDGQSGYPQRVYFNVAQDAFVLNHYNLQVTIDTAATFTVAGGYSCQVKSPALIDGRYQYRVISVRSSGLDPQIEVESTPSELLEVNVNNIDAAGQRVANSLPLISVPAASPGYPDFSDRVDLYRKDPDSDEFVKIFEHSGRSKHDFRDNASITNLPRIEFLKTENDETFAKINDAIGNTSGNYFMLFNKDNRLWTVPSDRKDLLLYSRENEWWGWKRENSFSFNGDITDVVTIRDINVVNGESTLVVFTTKGIYHVVGSGVESSPYVRVPMFGGDGNSEIDTYAGSALPFNGSIFFLAKSTDGGYETGAYGQKVYEYNLQQLVELSGRIKKTGTLDGDTNELEFVSLVAGDKYILKKLTNDTCLVYHKDARGWLTYSATAGQDWTWESKKFDRGSKERGTVANASRFKMDYSGEVVLTFKVWNGLDPSDASNYSEKSVTLGTPGGARNTIENMMPSNMGSQWSFKLVGTYDVSGSGEVYNMWFL